MDKKPLVKNFTNTYIYKLSTDYERHIVDYIMKADRIDKSSNAFTDIKYQVKNRQVTAALSKVLDSRNVILMHSPNPMPKAFKVMCVKDIKNDGKLRVFIDCSVILKEVNGEWQTNSIDVMISYLLNAMTSYIYFLEPRRIINNSENIKYGARLFSTLFTHVVNYLYKINLMEVKRDQCIYMSAVYYMTNILGLEFDSDRVQSVAKGISNLSDRELDIINIKFDKDSVLNLKTFIEAIGKVLKIEKLTTEVFLEKWIFIYGTGTQFALESFPHFSCMITDAYVGAYINNQKTIEKVAGKDMVDFTKNIFRIGSEVVR